MTRVTTSVTCVRTYYPVGVKSTRCEFGTRIMPSPPFDIFEFEESPIPPETPRRLDEITVRRDGCVWRIHKNDADPFPSNPHAHNVESGLKMSLEGGSLWDGSRATGIRIATKHLVAIRDHVIKKGFGLPPKRT